MNGKPESLVKGGAVALGLKALYRDLAIDLTINLYTDASGAKGIATRRGLGKLRHVEVHLLWLQHQVASGVFKINKIDGKVNPADLMTKYLTQDTMRKHMKRHRYDFMSGRAEACPEVCK